MRCRDCAWFHRPRGRVPTTCRHTGEAPEDEACSQFEPHVPEEDKKPVPAEVIGSLSHASYRDIFHTIAAESFVLEQDLHLAIETIRAQLQTQGANIPTDATEMRRTTYRLIGLYRLHRLSLAVGLGPYADQIMARAIDRMFGQTTKES